jgi:hypothetical protein
LILISVLIICIEVLVMDKRKKTVTIQVPQVANTNEEDKNNLPRASILKKGEKRLSI